MNVQKINNDGEFTLNNLTKNKVKKRRIKFRLYIIMLILILILAALSPMFNIRKIEVSGNIHYNKDDIIGVTNLVIGNNWFRTIGGSITDIFTNRCHNAEKSILKDRSYIRNVIVKYQFSGNVKILIEERKPRAILPYIGTELLIDDEGYILDGLATADNIKIPILRGVKFEKYKIGTIIKPTNMDNFNAFLKLEELISSLDNISKMKIYDKLTSIDISDINKINMVVDSRVMVKLGSISELDEYKINFLKEIYFLKLNKAEEGLLSFEGSDESPIFIPDK